MGYGEVESKEKGKGRREKEGGAGRGLEEGQKREVVHTGTTSNGVVVRVSLSESKGMVP